MAGKLDLNKEISLGGQARGKRPTKTSINLVIKKERKVSPVLLIGSIVLAALLLFLLVIRPVASLTAANARVEQLQTQLDEANKTIESLGDIEEEYAHYTTAGMTKEELERVDRVKVMKLVENAVVNTGVVKSWSLSENMMSLEVSGASLSELNQIASALEKNKMVDRCVINSANKGNINNKDTSGVAVSFIVYLTPAATAQTDAAASDTSKTEEGQKQ